MKIEVPHGQLEEIKRLADQIIEDSRQRDVTQEHAQEIINIASAIQNTKPRDSNPERDWVLTRIKALADGLGADQAAADIAAICAQELP